MINNVLYINLESRKDRKKSIEKTLSCFSNVERIDAVPNKYGCLGATRSHIKALEYAISKNWTNVLIVEDDMEWIDYNKVSILKSIPDYDVIVLGGVLVQHDSETHKLQKCNCAGAYLVSQKYYQTLLQNFKEGCSLLENELNKPLRIGLNREKRRDVLYRIDIWWHSLQQKDNWYILPLMYSPPGYSDTLYKIVDHSNLFLKE
jgi:GR25 family glycosyltransferase involved in LPS biosynthesis